MQGELVQWWVTAVKRRSSPVRALSAAVAWGVGEAISRAARKRKGELARPLSDWMPQSCLLAGDGRDGHREATRV